MKFASSDGEIEFGDGVLSVKKGKKGVPRVIDIRSVVAVTLLKPSLLVGCGCIYIQTVGGREYSDFLNATHYAGDKNAILFKGKKMTEEAEKFKSALDAFLTEAKARLTAPQPTESGDPYAELEKLKGLLDNGVISQEDYDAKKKQLLGL